MRVVAIFQRRQSADDGFFFFFVKTENKNDRSCHRRGDDNDISGKRLRARATGILFTRDEIDFSGKAG